MSQKDIPTLDDKNKSGSSAFANFQKNTSDQTKANEQAEEVEETIQTKLPSSELVFEIIYLEDPESKKSGSAYTKTEPVFLPNGVVEVKDAFGCLILHENVLNKKVVEMKCRQPITDKNFTVDCKSGILIKAVEPQDWMFNDEQTTRALYEKEVLETFRIVQTEVAKEMQEQAIQAAKLEAARQQQQRTPKRPAKIIQDDNEYYNPNNDPQRKKHARFLDDEELTEL